MKRLLVTFVIISALLFSGMLYCYYNFQFWTHLRTENFEALSQYKGENIVGLRGRQILVHKNFIPYITELDEYAKRNNVKLVINQSYRFSGQKVSRSVVNPVKLSNHLAGFAVDFNIVHNRIKYFSSDLKRSNLKNLPQDIQNFINDIRQYEYLRWGGDFNREDPIHIDNPINIDNRKEWFNYTESCRKDFLNGMPKWKIWKKDRRVGI